MHKLNTAMLLCIGLTTAGHSFAGSENRLPSCYSEKLPATNNTSQTDLFVLIDQTTLFDHNLKQSIANNIRPFIKAGNNISVSKFSAYTQGHYMEVVVNVKLDSMMLPKEADSVSKPVLSKYKQCMTFQPKFASKLIGNALKQTFLTDSEKIDKSDVIVSLKEFSKRVRQSQAEQKIVLIASDMLENSSMSSFYANQSVRHIDASKELSLSEKNNAIGDFDGASVYVIGAGLLVNQSNNSYRQPQVMQAIYGFWDAWFKKSNATLVEFGQPALLNDLYGH